ncbi:MAG: class I mannose-6-phosphate isomerase [Cyclobacteriaceae bacterium]|nr:class I mannose-6-phosphate isomerase [Cyclobacteriaceae bacterium]
MSNSKLYPFKFNPILKDKIWGGEKLSKVLDKPTDSKECGESWELSGVKGDISVVAEGELKDRSLTELIDIFKGDLLGEKVYSKFGSEFPLLIKFIDANEDLSIQVHPNDVMAKARHNSFGKTEMWYVVDAEPGATLISGFNKPTNREEYLEYFNGGRLVELLNKEKVVNDDVFFLPAGRVHTIGKGLLIAEIQQTSDITYRIYDFDRTDAQGNKRELHVDQALDAIDFTFYTEYKTLYDKTAATTELVSCNYFTTNKLEGSKPIERNYTTIDSFVVLMCLKGEGVIEYEKGKMHYKLGDTILIPNKLNEVAIKPEEASKLLEVFVPN